jgi:hypothetical protein
MNRSRLLLAALLLPASASAYTDPGSGALLWQMIVAGFVGMMFYGRRILKWFGNLRKH